MPIKDDERVSKPRVQSAARAIAILMAISRSSDGMKAKEISETMRLSRQTTYHLIHTLLGIGILRKNDQGRYVLGLGAGVIADGFARHLSPSEHLGPRVRAVVAATGETAYASGWIDGDIIALIAMRGEAAVSAGSVQTGLASHAHARASGKLLMAFAGRAEREHYLARHDLTMKTAKTIVSREALDRELAAIRKCGYAIDDEEFAEGLCCLAVPIEGVEGRFVLCVSAPKERFDVNRDKYLRILRERASLDEGSRLESSSAT
ncbi:MAG TPA: IclR family transcriptional regulator [Bryobacteraceae bacterium]|nr:IclR family transcriptional regulator [Bryobacteraceae bacterium]